MESETSPRQPSTTDPDGAVQTPPTLTDPPPDQGKDEFLMPGPTSTSNEGAARWAISWIGFSLVLMLVMLLMTVLCFGIARLGGLA